MKIQHFFDKNTSTLSYVVYDEFSTDAVIIDSVLDYEPQGSIISTESVENIIQFITDEDLTPHYILETHAHADHLSGAQTLQAAFPNIKLAIGKNIQKVQQLFKSFFDFPTDFPVDGRQFDVLLEEGKSFTAGTLKFEVLYTPGHTPACATYKIEDVLFTGDALFMPDSGTGRCDFPGGSAIDLFHSIKKLYQFPDSTKIYVAHDYQPAGRELRFQSTVGEQKVSNIQLKESTTLTDFVTAKESRDKTLSAPRLLYQSVQVNIDAGKLPLPLSNNIRYFKIPINVAKSK